MFISSSAHFHQFLQNNSIMCETQDKSLLNEICKVGNTDRSICKKGSHLLPTVFSLNQQSPSHKMAFETSLSDTSVRIQNEC